MAKKNKSTKLPSHEEIVEFLQKSSQKTSKRDIAKAFQIKGGDNRRALKEIIKNLEASGVVEKSTKSSISLANALPELAEIEITGVDSNGNLIGRPRAFKGEDGQQNPQVLISQTKRNLPDIEQGDLVLAKLSFLSPSFYKGEVVRLLKNEDNTIVGIYEAHRKGLGGILIPAERIGVNEFYIKGENVANAKDGDLVQAEIISMRKGNNSAKVLRVLGDGDDTKNISLIAVYQKNIPDNFSSEITKEAKVISQQNITNHRDLTKINFVTIDGEDARDFDDAIFAEPDDSPQNKGGWAIKIAIADVASYVKSGTLLDKEAYKRGNSTYFPDRAIPMLPPELSSNACSLLEGENRACVVFHISIDKDGEILAYDYDRYLIKSKARLNYNEVQKAFDGEYNNQTSKVKLELDNIYNAFKVLLKARKNRNALELERDELRIIADNKGNIINIASRPYHESHKAVEEFMIAANVCAARALENKKALTMYRTHEKPTPEKMYNFREFMKSIKVKINKGQQINNELFNQIIKSSHDKPEAFVVNEMILRSQTQAYYGTEKIGHSGLALESYVHFTSPIRRYSDLLVHRALFDELSDSEKADFYKIAKHISFTERRSSEAERETADRYLAYYLRDRLNETFNVVISGLSRAGLFVRIPEYGADGFVPMRLIAGGYLVYDPDRQAMLGEKGKVCYKLGDKIKAQLIEIMPLTGGMIFQIEKIAKRK